MYTFIQHIIYTWENAINLYKIIYFSLFLKDIVTDNSNIFDLVGFIPLLRERIYTENTFAKQFIISWITVLDDVPSIDLVIYLPEILDGLFKMLSDPTFEIKKM